MHSRLSDLQATLSSNQALFLSSSKDISYYCNYLFLVPEEREAFLFVTANSVHLLHMHFSPLPEDLEGITTHAGCHPTYLKKHLTEICESKKITTLEIDEASLFVNEYLQIKEITNLKLQNLDRKQIWRQRTVKSKDELQKIKEASIITSSAVATAIKQLKPGISEIEFMKILEENMHKSGGEKLAFPTIIAFGEHTALPHHQPTHKKLTNNMALLIDIGTSKGGYCSDMTRSFWFGDTPDSEYTKIQNTVHTAYDMALIELRKVFFADELTLLKKNEINKDKSIKNNDTKNTKITAKKVDNTVRDYITQKNYAEYFIHTTGHGLGLDIHEPPSVSWRNTQNLVSGMTITIEPGIYLPNKFGYRYENTVSLT